VVVAANNTRASSTSGHHRASSRVPFLAASQAAALADRCGSDRRAAATRAIPTVNAIAPAPAAVSSSHRRRAAAARRRAIRRRHALTPAASRAGAVSAAGQGPATIHLLRGSTPSRRSFAHDRRAGNSTAVNAGKSAVSGPGTRLSGVTRKP
jgi:hypothetical protein